MSSSEAEARPGGLSFRLGRIPVLMPWSSLLGIGLIAFLWMDWFVGGSLDGALAALYQEGLCNLLVEGGAGLATAFLQAGLVQRISHYLNPSYLGTGLAALGDYGLHDLHRRITLNHVKYTLLGDDIVLTGRL